MYIALENSRAAYGLFGKSLKGILRRQTPDLQRHPKLMGHRDSAEFHNFGLKLSQK